MKVQWQVSAYTALTDFPLVVRPPSVKGFEVCFETSPGEQAKVNFAQFNVIITIEGNYLEKLPVSRDGLDPRHTAIASGGMNLKHPLCKVQTDDANFLHGCSLL